MLTGSGASLVAGDLETRKSDPPHSLGALFALFNQIPSDKGYLCGVYSQHLLAAGLGRVFCSCGWSSGLNSLLTGSPDCKPGRRLNQPFQRYSRSLPEHFCSQAYGRPSRDRWWHCLDFGTPFHNLGIRGLTSCWEPSAPLWHCLDLARGPSMPDSLDGSASMFEIERISSNSHLKRVFSGSKEFLAVTIWCTQDSIWGFLQADLLPQSARELRFENRQNGEPRWPPMILTQSAGNRFPRALERRRNG
jgi:hypothetical protein